MGNQNQEIRGVNTNLSYFIIREIIGYAGLALPWVLMLIAMIYCSSSDYFYQTSISHYYYTFSGVIFVGFLTLIGVFLMSYRGYKPEKGEISDNTITWIGGFLILTVALVPTPFGPTASCPTPICHDNTWLGYLHFGSAVGFFIAMSYMSIKKFTKGEKPFSPDKIKRNYIYKACGWTMLGVLAIAGVLFLCDVDEQWDHMVFWVEVAMLTPFGISWLVKGKGLVRLKIQKDD